jgi:hypothetical protein
VETPVLPTSHLQRIVKTTLYLTTVRFYFIEITMYFHYSAVFISRALRYFKHTILFHFLSMDNKLLQKPKYLGYK